MRQGLLFVLPALTLTYAGMTLPNLPLRLLACWTAGSFFCVAIGYFALGGKVFGKRPDGTLSPIRLLAFAPYLILALIVASACRWIFREPPCQQIAEHLHLGRRLRKHESWILDQRNVIAVLDLTAATPEPKTIRDGRAYRNLPLLDATAPSLEALSDTVRWIVDQTKTGPVYVHCAAGHGRAGLLSAAYLLATGKATDADDAIRRLREIRPLVWLNRVQRRRLDELVERTCSGA